MSDLLSLSRMARRIGVTQKWLRDEANSGKIPCLKAGNRYLFNPVTVQESLAAKAARSRQGATMPNSTPTKPAVLHEPPDSEGGDA